jgi:ribosomal protein RSM22 (predicted rRNA methylase)
VISKIMPPQTNDLLHSVPLLIEKTFPVPKRFRSALPSQIKELSGLLTNRRGDRSLSYLGRPNYLNAYLHYFLPWNLYRLCFLLPLLDLKFNNGDTITDLGSGPLTFVSALWIARPDLRSLQLEIDCIDRSGQALEAGKVFFQALAENENIPWKINLVREDIDIRKNTLRKEKQASLVCAINLFNEIYEKIPHSNTEKLKQLAGNAAQLMHNLAKTDACILTVEPGVPQSGRFISLMRNAFIELGCPPLSPCTHSRVCPCGASGKKRWCHFAFETTNVEKELLRLSAAAGLPKDRLVLSYLLSGKIPQNSYKNSAFRIISDAFPLPQNRSGRYACSASGLVLLSGEKKQIERFVSGGLFNTETIQIPVTSQSQWAGLKFQLTDKRDAKSGALIMEVK